MNTVALVILVAVAVASLVVSVLVAIRLLKIERITRALVVSINSRTIKSLVKSLERKKKKRVRKRYLVFEIIPLGHRSTGDFEVIEKDELERLLKNSFREIFGELELSLSGISVIMLDKEALRGIIRFRSGYRAKLLFALGVLQASSKRFLINPIKTTGTLRKALRYVQSR